MAPRNPPARRQTQSANEHVYAPGVVGRRTGIQLPESEARDEYGFETGDIFSPEPELRGAANDRKSAPTDTVEDEPSDQEEQDMELDDGSDFGPRTARKLQQGRLSIPRARSPIKTNLQSPARRNPHIVHSSSPTRGTIFTGPQRSPDRAVPRRLDFSKSQVLQPATNGPSKAGAASGGKEKLTNGHSQLSRHHNGPTSRADDTESEDEDEEDEDDPMDLLAAAVVHDEPEEEEEQEQEEAPPTIQEAKAASKSNPGRKGRKPKARVEEAPEEPADAVPEAPEPIAENGEDGKPVKRRKGRPKATASRPKEEEPSPVPDPAPPKPSKRGRPARDSAENAEQSADEPRDTKRQKTAGRPRKMEQSAAPKSVVEREKGKPGRKRKSSGVGVESPKIQRGPPLPRSRGLVTIRREEVTAMKTTRSGRTSFKPLEWWKGEHVEYDEEEERLFTDAGNRHFKMPTVKGIVRTEEPAAEPSHKRRGRPATGRKQGRRASAIPEEEEVEREDWEYDPGHVEGTVATWKAEHEFDPPDDDDEVDEETVDLAISENAIQLRDIKDATFKFAKTLTMPFFGAGIVALPPGAHKRTRNARKMQLVFFVHTGNVQVTVGRTEFGIAKGGMFFVPRGTQYGLRNEKDKTARLFFAQGCEMLAQMEYEEDETPNAE